MKSDPVDAVIEAMQSKAQPTKAANRAAKVVLDKVFCPEKFEPGWAARLIDLETGLPELIAACKAALPFVGDHVCRTLGEGPADRIAYDMLEAALKKAEGT